MLIGGNNEQVKVRLECGPKLLKGHSKVDCAHPPLVQSRWSMSKVCALIRFHTVLLQSGDKVLIEIIFLPCHFLGYFLVGH